MAPAPTFRISRAARAERCMGAVRFTSRTLGHWARGTVRAEPGTAMAALFTRTSTRPRARAAPSTKRSRST
jgi:hypothetical protein